MDLSTIEARKQIAAKHAAKYGLDLALVCAVIEHESSWNPWAVRFEPEFEARYIKPALPLLPTTRELTEAMSFGLMQIMGETAIEFGFTGRFLTELCDPDQGIEYGCKKLQRCFSTHKVTDIALLDYNGGGDPNYPQLVAKFLPKYQEQQA